ncbi:ABC transporter permease [Flagellimonas sp. S3867]|uniref:ABC transporter permease n=1 Tax=Flagellimonas sp. S3867 TaxID=2768063 RepID=UPI0016820A6D|nr:ABC transporter permease [Flagellimonas sp. S3867]
MFKNHIKIAFRFFLKNKLFTGINILGLSIGITAFMLLARYIAFEKSYDQFIPHIDDLYRVTLTSNLGDKGFYTVATNHPAVGPAMERDFPEVESYARIVDKSIVTSGTIILSYENVNGDLIKLDANDDHICFADNAILDMFDLPLLHGNPSNALEEPNTVVLTKEIAKRFFGNEDPLGKIIKINNGFELKINGVFDDIPLNTHLPLGIVVSYATFPREGDFDNSWVWPEFYSYVKLKAGTEPQAIQSKFPAFVQNYLSDIMNQHGFEARFDLQPVKDIHLTSNIDKEISANNSRGTLNFLLIVAGFIIAIALINFINLSTAKSMERAKEVGLKKVVGANKKALVQQFLYESLLINFLALLLAFLFISLLMSPFNTLVGIEVLDFSMWAKREVWLTVLGIFLGGGILAGLYPAFVLSNFIPIEVLKGNFHHGAKGNTLRKALVITQFVISIALIAGTFIVYNQFSYMQNQDLGFKADQNLVISAPIYSDSTMQHKITSFKRELMQNPKIGGVALSNEIPGKPVSWSNLIRKPQDLKETASAAKYVSVDHDFFKTYGVALIAGRDYNRQDANFYNEEANTQNSKTSRVIINRSAAKILGFSEPEEAINKRMIFELRTERNAEIIGVVEDYHQQSLQNAYEPMVFLYFDYYNADYITINILGGNNVKEAISDIEASYKSFFPNDLLKHFFVDEYFNKQYQADLKFGTICLLFSILAIFIAALGLFGMGSHMAMQKIKEISMRKVLGASVGQALIIIPKKLLSLVLISSVIALPLIYFITKKWLENYAFKIDMGLWMFLVPLLVVMLVATLSILAQSLKAALINPAESLRTE